MQDLACLIVPRKLVIVAGKEDIIFPINGVYRGYKTVESIYKKAGHSDNLELVITPKGHHWCPDETWDAIKRMHNK